MNIFEAVDHWILGRCTRFSHWLQRTVGLTNFFVAKVGVFLMSLGIVVDVANYWLPLISQKTSLGGLIFGVNMLFFSVFLVYLCNLNEERLYNGESLFDMTFRYPTRISYLLLFVLSIFRIEKSKTIFELLYYLSFSLGSSITVYFISVIPIPPGMNKLGEFVKNLKNSFRKLVPVSTTGLSNTSLSK